MKDITGWMAFKNGKPVRCAEGFVFKTKREAMDLIRRDGVDFRKVYIYESPKDPCVSSKIPGYQHTPDGK